MDDDELPPRARNARRARVDRRADAAEEHLLQDVFPINSMAQQELSEEIDARIFSVPAASATLGWIVPNPDRDQFGPPVLYDREQANPNGRYEYPFQEQMPARNRSWESIKKKTTFFYQAPDNHTFYLRAKESNLGVDNEIWSSVFTNPPRRLPAKFRHFELIDTTGLNRFSAANHLNSTVYFEVDLASRAPRPDFDIPINVYQDSDLDDMLMDSITASTNLIIRQLFGTRQDNDGPFVNLVVVIVALVAEIGLPRIFSEPVVRIVVSYEVHSREADELILLSKTGIFRPDDDESAEERLTDLVRVIFRILNSIRESALVDHYQVNGTHIFHPRLVRIILSEMPMKDGSLYLKPPRGLIMPRGGCLSIAGMPKALIELLGRSVVSHDVHKPGSFFDNNCGIREILMHDIDISNAAARGDLKSVYLMAAELRSLTPGLPPFIKLNPQQVAYAAQNQYPDCDVFIFSLPTPEEPMGNLYSTVDWDDAEANGVECPFFLIYSHGHYFGLRAFSTPERLELFRQVMRKRYCKRCSRYCEEGEARISHDFEVPQLLYPPCARKRKPVAVPPRNEFGASIHEDDDKIISERRILRAVKPQRYFELTPLDHIGFMDLETYRPSDNGYHETYAVGLIVEADWNIEVKNVKLFSSVDDPLVNNAALVHAFVALIAHLSAKGDRYTRKKPYYLYLYNGSGFDNLFILHVLASAMKMHPDNMALKDGRLMTISYLDGSLIIRDLCLFTSNSLKKLCKEFEVTDKLAKGKLDHDSITSLQVVENRWAEIAEYLCKDLTALNMVFLKYRQTCFEIFDLDICSRITRSHLAYDFWIKSLTDGMRAAVTLPDSYDEYMDILRAYCGGRTTPLVKNWKSIDGDKPYADMKDYLIDLDVVSLYPSSMWFSTAISQAFYKKTKRNIPLYFCGDPTFIWQEGDTLFKAFVELFSYFNDIYAPWRSTDEPSMEFWHDHRLLKPMSMGKVGYIVCVDIKAPEDLMMAILPHKNAKGDTAWDLLPHEKQWYVFEEVLDAIYYGYEITKLHCMYRYPTRLALFDTVMELLMRKKAACKRGDPKRTRYKSAANDTYGKSAQKANEEDVRLIYPSELANVMESEYVLSVEPICKEEDVAKLRKYNLNKERWIGDNPDRADEFEDELRDEDLNIAVECFVLKTKPESVLPTKPTYLGCQTTAYSRIHMNFCLHKLGLLTNCTDIKKQVFYTDTDSAIVHSAATLNIPPGLFGDELGQLSDELEGGRIIEFVALAPKTYVVVYKTSDENVWMKVRAKGFPHTKKKLKLDIDPVDLDDTWFNEDGQLITRKISLGKRLYCVERLNGSKLYYNHLSHEIYKDILFRKVKDVTVYFTSMRRCYFGLHDLGHISGIKHSYMHRSLRRAVWWDGEEDDGEFHRKPKQYGPCHRKENPAIPGLTFPLGHFFFKDLEPV